MVFQTHTQTRTLNCPHACQLSTKLSWVFSCWLLNLWRIAPFSKTPTCTIVPSFSSASKQMKPHPDPFNRYEGIRRPWSTRFWRIKVGTSAQLVSFAQAETLCRKKSNRLAYKGKPFIWEHALLCARTPPDATVKMTTPPNAFLNHQPWIRSSLNESSARVFHCITPGMHARSVRLLKYNTNSTLPQKTDACSVHARNGAVGSGPSQMVETTQLAITSGGDG